MSDFPVERRRRQVGGSLSMGAFSAPVLTHDTAGTLIEPRPLTLLVREERCEGCLWPAVCTTDRTCWKEERVERRRVRRAVVSAASGPAPEGRATRETIGQAILRLIAPEGSSTSELAALVGKDDRIVYQAAKILSRSGKLVVHNRGPRAGGNLWKKPA